MKRESLSRSPPPLKKGHSRSAKEEKQALDSPHRSQGDLLAESLLEQGLAELDEHEPHEPHKSTSDTEKRRTRPPLKKSIAVVLTGADEGKLVRRSSRPEAPDSQPPDSIPPDEKPKKQEKKGRKSVPIDATPDSPARTEEKPKKEHKSVPSDSESAKTDEKPRRREERKSATIDEKMLAVYLAKAADAEIGILKFPKTVKAAPDSFAAKDFVAWLMYVSLLLLAPGCFCSAFL